MARDFDWVLFAITIILSVFGIIVIYSATRTLDSITNVVVQSAAFCLGTAALIVVCLFDYEQFKNLVKPIYIFSIVILVLVLIFGVTGDWGARSWIRFGPIGIQPAEFAKLCFILTFSYHLEKVLDDINKPLVILGLLAHVGAVAYTHLDVYKRQSYDCDAVPRDYKLPSEHIQYTASFYDK